MPQTKKRIDVVKVVRHTGQQISLPQGPPPMTIPQAVEVLQRQHAMEEEQIRLIESIPCFPWDGAVALQEVLLAKFGVIFQEDAGFSPPTEISVEVNYRETVTVRWGKFAIPGTEAGKNYFMTSLMPAPDGAPALQLTFVIQRKYEDLARDIAQAVRDRLEKHSIYRGKAFRLSNFDPGEFPRVKFLDLSQVNREEMVFSSDLEHLIQVNLWTPIQDSDIVKSLRVPLKRGILLAGPYGTGKTLLAYITAELAIVSGWTFIYLDNVRDLADAILWAKRFGRVVIFCEDLDQADTDDTNSLPNTLDGLDTKDSEVMVVLTTNHLDKVSPILLRPGRLDCILPIEPPDSEAHTRLIGVYGRGMLEKGQDFTSVGEMLAKDNVIPAVTREVVERAKLAYITRCPDLAAQGVVRLTADDLMWSAKTIQGQAALLKPREVVHDPVAMFGKAVGNEVGKAIGKLSASVAEQVANEIADRC